MNKIFSKFFLPVVAALLFSACSPDKYSISEADVKVSDLVEGLAFRVEHDAANPNIIYLVNLMGKGYTALWNHPQGKSQGDKVTLKMPFPGTYSVQFGVETRGGIVYGEPVSFTVSKFYADFVNDELWTKLSGGIGHEKTWYLDLDENGLSRFFAGPLYFYGTAHSWESVTDGAEISGDNWSWNAKWSENAWLMAAADFGSMTFNLKGGANVEVEHKTISTRGTETGTYSINTAEHTMRLTNASPLHDSNRNGQVADWGNIKILSLTDNTMQLAVLRDPALSGEAAALFVYNFISKDYRDNWVPDEPQLPYAGKANADLTTTSTKKWKLSETTPYNWAKLDGTLVNNWTSAASYTAYNPFSVRNISLSMTKTSDLAGTYIFTTNTGGQIKGTYKVDDKNNIDFKQPISFPIFNGVNLAATSENLLRVIRSETDQSGNISGIWLGQRLTNSPQYLVYHFELATGTVASNGTEIAFDGTRLKFGDIENKGNYRIEIYNAYGETSANPPLDAANFRASSLEVTFTLSGIAFNAGASGSYPAAIYFADDDWSARYEGGGAGDVTVTGNGTYTVWGTTNETASGIKVFVIDLKNIRPDIQDFGAVRCVVNKIVVR